MLTSTQFFSSSIWQCNYVWRVVQTMLTYTCWKICPTVCICLWALIYSAFGSYIQRGGGNNHHYSKSAVVFFFLTIRFLFSLLDEYKSSDLHLLVLRLYKGLKYEKVSCAKWNLRVLVCKGHWKLDLCHCCCFWRDWASRDHWNTGDFLDPAYLVTLVNGKFRPSKL